MNVMNLFKWRKNAIAGKGIKAVLFTVMLLPAIANAGIFDDDEARKAILDLRAKITALTAKLDSKLDEKADRTSALELSNQNEKLRSEIAVLRGQIEVLINDLLNTQKRQQDFYIDLDKRLRALEPKKITVDGREVILAQGEQAALDVARGLYKAGQFSSAVDAFVSFGVNFPDSVFANQAQYWLGNSYYAQRDWKNTIVVLQALLKKFPEHVNASDAMLNIAACQLELKDKKESKKTLDAIIAKFPGTEAAQIAKSRLPSTK
jgi:tol-pal system protein YbgF